MTVTSVSSDNPDYAAAPGTLSIPPGGSAGLDVYENEPALAPGLRERENVVLLPHLGSATEQTRANMARLAARNIIDALQGRRPESLVNGEVWKGR